MGHGAYLRAVAFAAFFALWFASNLRDDTAVIWITLGFLFVLGVSVIVARGRRQLIFPPRWRAPLMAVAAATILLAVHRRRPMLLIGDIELYVLATFFACDAALSWRRDRIHRA
jgi:hypothetical protein